MYIHAVEHNGREESVLAAQLIGFMYESHCWVDGTDAGHRVCLWCEGISKEDMKMEGTPGKEPILCHANPLIQGTSLHDFLGKPKPKATKKPKTTKRKKRKLVT